MAVAGWRRLKISTKVALSISLIVIAQAVVLQIGTSRLIRLTNKQYFSQQMETRLRGIGTYLSETLNDMQVKANLLAGQKKVVEYTEYRLRNMLYRELTLFKTPLRIDSIAIFLSPDRAFLSVGDVEHSDPAFGRRLSEVFSSGRGFFVSRQPLSVRLWVFSKIVKENKILGVVGLALDIDRAFVNRLENNTDAIVLLSIGNHIIDTWSVSPGLRFETATMAGKLLLSDSYQTVGDYMAGAISLSVLGEKNAAAICLVDMSSALQLITRHNQLFTIYTLLILAVALGASYLFYRITFLRPFSRLQRAVRRISDGDFDYSIERTGYDEIGEFAAAFENMRRSLIRRDEELSQLERFNNLILDNVRSGIVTVDLSERIVSCNPAAQVIMGIGTGSAIALTDLPPVLVVEIQAALRENRFVTGKEARISIGRREVILSITTSPLVARSHGYLGVTAIVVDATRERRLEEQLERSSRMVAMGEMAAGVAHQIRNPIAIMKVSAGMLQTDMSDESSLVESRSLADVIVNEIDNLDRVVSNLLNFTRPIRLNRQSRWVRETIDDALRLVPLYQYPDARLDVRVHDSALMFPIDKNLLEQIVANLVQNSLEAMTSPGTIHIRAFLRDDTLWIEVEDEGPGISEEIAQQMFTPFFTTKSTGTGLGLSIVHRLVEQHGGTVDLRSRAGQGALFRIILRPTEGESA
jgi:nitrogen fixation/metabolism regulation signal transduction histidine kinase